MSNKEVPACSMLNAINLDIIHAKSVLLSTLKGYQVLPLVLVIKHTKLCDLGSSKPDTKSIGLN
jgi:hypothetical protein